jgi:hypothetical protein
VGGSRAPVIEPTRIESHVGIVRLAPLEDAGGDGATGPSRVTAELHVEGMDLTVNGLP